MVFNSVEFLIFFLVFFILYWFVFRSNLRIQNFLLLAGSYAFYGWWDWRFLLLLSGTSLVNYYLGIRIYRTEDEKQRRLLLFLGMLQGLGTLIFFKYFDFFITSFANAFAAFHINLNIHTLNLILPLGISFYTFRALSYLIDVDHGKIEPTRSWPVFFIYISFFPTLLSGPIDKAKTFIPQLEKKRVFDYDIAMDGICQILWGLFKKLVVADNCSVITDQLFDKYQHLPASSLLLGIFLYTVQIYADFSGYSDMAIGFSRLLGFNVTKNFNFPFFAQNIADFWQRWHISLTSWMTEYVFTPLSFIFRDLGKKGLFLAILINFVIVGLWHGARWTFIVYGFLQGCYFIPLIITGTLNQKRLPSKNNLPTFRQLINMVGTFTLVMMTTIIFRSESLSEAGHYYAKFFSWSLFRIPAIASNKLDTLITISFVFFMFLIEWLGRDQNYAIEKLGVRWPNLMRWGFYYVMAVVIFLFAGQAQQFVYLQF